MAAQTREQLRTIIGVQDGPNKFMSKMIDSFANKEDDNVGSQWFGTALQYDALGSYDDNVLYFILEPTGD